MKKKILSILPWIITAAAIAFVCNGLDWDAFLTHARNSNPSWLFAAFLLTLISYFVRSYRWLFFFPNRNALSYVNAVKVLLLGFFMNNILPARAGELVRAHMGARVASRKRTLVLATVASERLVDGLTISIFFLYFSTRLSHTDIGSHLTIVAYFFACATAGVLLTLVFRGYIYRIFDAIAQKLHHRYSDYLLSRLQMFLEGLSPLASLQRFPAVTLLSLIIWGVELAVYGCVAEAFSAPLPIAALVLFMVTVNFSSLIPAAPGAIGVIEAVTTTVLVQLGIEKELALSMVLSQHIIQYLSVGIPGIFVLSTWKQQLKSIEEEEVLAQ